MKRGKTRKYSINYQLIYGKNIKSRPERIESEKVSSGLDAVMPPDAKNGC